MRGEFSEGNPNISEVYYTDLQGNRIEEIFLGEEVYLVLKTKNMIGKPIDINLSDNTFCEEMLESIR